MFGRYHKSISEYTNYYLDFSRVGELLATRHRYSNREIAVRSGMIAVTVASGLIGAYVNDPDTSGWGDYTIAAASALLGFVISHTIVIVPLIQKRCNRHTECVRVMQSIRAEAHRQGLANVTDLVEACMQRIMSFSLANELHSNASRTWGRRQAMLENLYAKLAAKELPVTFWSSSDDHQLNVIQDEAPIQHDEPQAHRPAI